jgi:hypothetical protein
MTCHFCGRPIPRAQLNNHHIIPKSQGGVVTAPAHRSCHVKHHSTNGHFRYWGRVGGQLSAITRQWAFNLKHIRDDPAYELDRQFYRMFYAKG